MIFLYWIMLLCMLVFAQFSFFFFSEQLNNRNIMHNQLGTMPHKVEVANLNLPFPLHLGPENTSQNKKTYDVNFSHIAQF